MKEKYNKLIKNQLSKSLVFTIDNFRVFNTPTTFELAPITILTGPNNSGKSSLVKALLMLRNNSSDIPYEVILPNKNLDLPRVSDVLNNVNQLFTLAFRFNSLHFDFQIQINFNHEAHNSNLYFNAIQVKNNDKVVLEFDDFFQLTSESIIDMKFWINYSKTIYTTLINRNNLKSNTNLFEIVHEDSLLGEVTADVKNDFAKILEEVLKSISSFNLMDLDPRLSKILDEERLIGLSFNNSISEPYNSTIGNRLKIINRHLYFELLKKVDENIPGNFKIIKTEFFKYFEKSCQEFSELIGFELSKFTDIEVLPISKSKQSRYFQAGESGNSFLADAAVNFFEMQQLDYNKYYEFKLWMSRWLERFEIGSSINVNNIESTGIYTIEIIDENANKRNLRDFGFGVSQIVTLLLSPYKSDFVLDTYQSELNGDLTTRKERFYNKQPLFYLEEPESNLHPNWQSLLMELIVDINQRFGIRFIIETHSEYMNRKLQYLMADKTRNLDTKNALVYYFNSDKNVNESEGEPKIKKISLDKSGSLSDNFGPGFYDEAINIQFDLLKLNKHQSN
jgi:predicted ATPase